VAYADGRAVEFSYNPLKQLTQMKDWLGITTVAMDALGRAEKITDFEDKTVQYKWDELNRKTEVVYPDLSEAKYCYNRSGLLTGVISANGETHYRYDAMGRISERMQPNELSTRYEFDPLGRLASLIHAKSGDVLDQFRYGYDPVGNITRIDKFRQGLDADNGIFTYSYDPLGRLVAASSGGRSKGYLYDSLGNRLAATGGGHKVMHQYNALNQLIRTHDGDSAEEYRYDGRGNLTEVLANGALKASYSFDATNMMAEAFSAAKGKAKYTYNGFQNRVKRLEQFGDPGAFMEGELQKTEPCREVRYILDMTLPYNNLLMTEGGITGRYIWGNELLAADGVDHFYYLQDHLGSPIRLMGVHDSPNQGMPLAYDEFGVPLVEARGANNPFGFTGYQMDSVSGLYFGQARYYEPQSARWLAEDTHWSDRNRLHGDERFDNQPSLRAITQSANLYAYCHNNPLAFLDPLGRSDVPVRNLLAHGITFASNIFGEVLLGDVGSRNIYLNIPGIANHVILEEGKHFYINPSNNRAYLINNPTHLLRNLQGVPDYAVDIIKNDLASNSKLYEGEDYYIGNDGNAYFYNNVRTIMKSRGWEINNCPIADKDKNELIFTKEERPGVVVTQTLIKGIDYYIGANGKAQFVDLAYGPPRHPGSVLDYISEYELWKQNDIDSNKAKNTALLKSIGFDHKSDYIYGQGNAPFTQFVIGGQTGGGTTCGPIAVYNASKLLGIYYSPADIIAFLENCGYLDGIPLVGNGIFGVKAIGVKDCFDSTGSFSTEMYNKPTNCDDIIKSAGAVVMRYRWHADNSLGFGDHYISIKWNGKLFEIYNEYNNSTTFNTYASIDDWIKSNKHTVQNLISINHI
jgi:RHS repeat-associated protein